VKGSEAKDPLVGGQEADEFLLALPQHRAGNFCVGAHGVVLEPDTLAFPDPLPDQGAAQVQDPLFALLFKRSFRNIASRPLFPKLGDILP
jgi:hypothetical protein